MAKCVERKLHIDTNELNRLLAWQILGEYHSFTHTVAVTQCHSDKKLFQVMHGRIASYNDLFNDCSIS